MNWRCSCKGNGKAHGRNSLKAETNPEVKSRAWGSRMSTMQTKETTEYMMEILK